MASTVAYEIPGFSWTLPSGADFTGAAAGQHRFVAMDSTQRYVNPALGAVGNRDLGVRCNKPNTNQAMTVRKSGVVMVEAGEQITVGQPVTTDATGKAIVADTATHLILGTCIVAASGNGVLCSVELATQRVAF